MWSRSATSSDTVYHAMSLFAIDVYYETPLSTAGNTVTAYGGFFHFDYGPGYLRIENPMNTTNGLRPGLATIGGSGNGYPGIGTGNTLYEQFAYKLKDNLLGTQGTLQFFLETQYSVFDALSDPMINYNVGLNWLIRGHGSKFTLNYENRPVFNSTTRQEISRKGCVVLQYQVAF